LSPTGFEPAGNGKIASCEGEDRLAKQGNRSSESITGPNADERARKRKPGKTGRPGW